MMRSKRVKRFLLAVLMAALIYVWWGNFQLFLPKAYQTDSVTPHPRQSQAGEAPKKTLSYRPPVINPFRKPERVPKSKAEKKEDGKVAPPAVKLGEEVLALGILEREAFSQAVIAVPSGSSQVMAIGDSLDLWELLVVKEEYVVFKRGRVRDTLRLGSKQD